MNKKLIIFDFNRTLYNPESKRVIRGVKNILNNYLKTGVEMILISRIEINRQDIMVEKGLAKYFTQVFFVKNKNNQLFKSILNKYNEHKIYVVGDYLYEEIYFGNLNHMETIWIKNGKFKNLKIRNKFDFPSYIVENINEITSII